MVIEKGKSYEYLGDGRSEAYKGQVFACKSVNSNWDRSYFNIGGLRRHYLINGRGIHTNRLYWKEVEEKKPRISYWK